MEDRTPLATATDFATYGRRSLSASDTATVEQLIAGASRRIRKFCGWHIWPVHVDEQLIVEGGGSRLLVLPTLALTSVSEVLEDYAGAAELVDATAYRRSRAGMLRRIDGGVWLGDFYEYAVTCTHGLEDNPDAPVDGSAAPEELRDMVCAIVGRAFTSPTGAIREQSGAVSITHSQTGPSTSGGIALLSNERDALGHYKIGAE